MGTQLFGELVGAGAILDDRATLPRASGEDTLATSVAAWPVRGILDAIRQFMAHSDPFGPGAGH